MKKKKWTRLRFLGLFFFCGLIIYSCLPDEQVINSTGQEEKLIVGDNRELTVVAAQRWYEQHNLPVVSVRSGSSEEAGNPGGFLVKPKWDEAKENRRGKFEVVEVTLTTDKPTLFMDNETKERFNQEKDYKQVHNIARLVVIKNLKTQEIIDFIMIFVGRYDYLKETRTFGKNSYLHRQPDYSGDVLFYSTKGGFLNGWRYQNGEITATISLGTEEGFLNSVATRAMQKMCHDEVSWQTVYDCWDEPYLDPEFGWIFSVVCTPTTVPVYSEVCEWIDDGLDDGDGWRPDGTGGGVAPPGGTPDTTNPKDPKNVLKNPKMKEGMKKAWQLVLESASKTNGRREVGAWLYFDSVSKQYYIGNWRYGEYVHGEGTHGSVEVGHPEASLNGDHIPRTSEAFSFMHAHTALTYEDINIRRQTGPSRPDIDYANKYPGYTFYLIDYVGHYDSDAGNYYISGGASENSPVQIYIYDGTGIIDTIPLN